MNQTLGGINIILFNQTKCITPAHPERAQNGRKYSQNVHLTNDYKIFKEFVQLSNKKTNNPFFNKQKVRKQAL